MLLRGGLRVAPGERFNEAEALKPRMLIGAVIATTMLTGFNEAEALKPRMRQAAAVLAASVGGASMRPRR